jgi:P27 family predicted phage terminase small subunit
MAKKSVKPSLKLVGSEGGMTSAEPPRTLGKYGRKLWDRVMKEYQVEDAGGVEMLAQACQALDRAEALHVEIDEDGAVIRSRGTVREHPALKHELSNRAFVVRTLSRLGLDVEPLRPSVGRPGLKVGWS